jgi:hypothetical protein
VSDSEPESAETVKAREFSLFHGFKYANWLRADGLWRQAGARVSLWGRYNISGEADSSADKAARRIWESQNSDRTGPHLAENSAATPTCG